MNWIYVLVISCWVFIGVKTYQNDRYDSAMDHYRWCFESEYTTNCFERTLNKFPDITPKFEFRSIGEARKFEMIAPDSMNYSLQK